MELLKITENVCRICLEHNERINWNNKVSEFCGKSLRDCYYKYTQLQEPDPDNYPKNLCARCVNDIKNAHILFEKALESFNILQKTFRSHSSEIENIFLKSNGSSQGSCNLLGENCFPDEKTSINIDEVICYSPVYEEAGGENELNENFYEPISIQLEEESYEDSYYKIMKNSTDKETKLGRMDLESLETTVELNVQLEIHGMKLLKSFAIKEANKTEALKSFLSNSIITQIDQDTKTNKDKEDSSLNLTKLPNDFNVEVFEEITIDPFDEPLFHIKCKQNTNNTKSLKAKNHLSKPVYTNSKQHRKSPDYKNLQKDFVADILEEISIEPLDQSPLKTKRKHIKNSKYLNSKESLSQSVNSNSERNKLLNPKNQLNVDIRKYCDAEVLEEITIEPLDEPLVGIKCKQKTSNPNLEHNENPIPTISETYVSQSSMDNIQYNPTRHRRNKFKMKKLESYLFDNSTEESENLSKEEVYALLEELCGSELKKNSAKKARSQKPKEVMCQYCSKVFISNYKATEHEKTHLKDRERNETCSKCGLKFYDKNALRSHMYTHADNREKTFKCEYCGKAFYNNNGLSVHLKIHVGPRIPCSVCKKEYYRQSDLDKHMITHSASRVNGDLKHNKKYFVFCKICGKEVRSIMYKSHIARHKNEPLAKCAICSKEFYSRSSCNKHLTTVHKKKTGERSKYVISYKTKYFSKLFLEQSTGTLFTKQ